MNATYSSNFVRYGGSTGIYNRTAALKQTPVYSPPRVEYSYSTAGSTCRFPSRSPLQYSGSEPKTQQTWGKFIRGVVAISLMCFAIVAIGWSLLNISKLGGGPSWWSSDFSAFKAVEFLKANFQWLKNAVDWESIRSTVVSNVMRLDLRITVIALCALAFCVVSVKLLQRTMSRNSVEKSPRRFCDDSPFDKSLFGNRTGIFGGWSSILSRKRKPANLFL